MTDRPEAPERERVLALDGVRGLAIVLVVCMHGALEFAVHLRIAPTSAVDSGFRDLLMLGWCGVDVFFVLSGFLITGILLRAKGSPHYFRDFYARRALRIFPLYYAVIVLLLFVLDRPPTTAGEKASYLLYYQNIAWAFRPESSVDLARWITWSLAIEEQFYLVWPAVVLLCSRRVLTRLCVVLIAAAMVLRGSLLAAGVENVYFLTPCRMDELAAGALLALLPVPPRWFGALCGAVGAAGLVAVAVWSGLPLPTGNPAMQSVGLVTALLIAVSVLTFARRGACPWLFENGVLRSFGRYSYCIYLTHLLVIGAITDMVDRRLLVPRARALLAEHAAAWPMLLFVAVCLLATWLVGLLSWHLFEKWFLALKRRFGG